MNLKQLTKRIEFWRNSMSFMGLGHFEVDHVGIVENPQGNPHSQACAMYSDDYDSVSMEFAESFVSNASEETIDRVIIHEWLHVALRDLEIAMRMPITQLAAPVVGVWQHQIDHEMEGLIERLSRQLYDFYYLNVVQ